MYPIIEMHWARINALFFPIFFEMYVITGITKKDVMSAPTDPWRAGQFPADAGSLLNK